MDTTNHADQAIPAEVQNVESGPLRGGMAQVVLATLASTVGFWAWMLIAPLQKTYATAMHLDEGGQISLMLATPVLVGALGRIVVGGAYTDRFGGRKMFSGVLVAAVPAVLIVMFAGMISSFPPSSRGGGVPARDRRNDLRRRHPVLERLVPARAPRVRERRLRDGGDDRNRRVGVRDAPGSSRRSATSRRTCSSSGSCWSRRWPCGSS